MDVMKEENIRLRQKIKVDVIANKEKEKESEVNDNATSVLRTLNTYLVREVESEYHSIPNSHHSLIVHERHRHPLIDNIIETPLPKHWKSLVLDHYDGTTNPKKHIFVYIMQISL